MREKFTYGPRHEVLVLTEKGIFYYGKNYRKVGVVTTAKEDAAKPPLAIIARRDRITKFEIGRILKTLTVEYMEGTEKIHFYFLNDYEPQNKGFYQCCVDYKKQVGIPLEGDLTPDDFGVDVEALGPVPDSKEFRKRCNVCGHVYCFTMGDMRKNQQLIQQSKRESMLGASQTLFSSQLMGKMNMDSARKKLDQVVDYSRCPNCRSTNVVDVPEGEPIRIAEPSAAPAAALASSATSAMDELKKLKELLDVGIVTQEEFDAKKKQLLGL